MRIGVRYFAVLREQRGLSAEEIETTAATPAALYDELQREHGFRLDRKWLQVAVNDRFAAMDAPLAPGDTITFIPPVAGG